MTTTPDFYLLVPVRLAGATLRPGRALFISQDNVPAIMAAAGPGGVWPGSDATVAAAVAAAAKRVSDGTGSDAELSAILVSAAAASAKASGLQELTATIKFQDFAALGAGVMTKDYLLGAVLPTGARLAALPVLEAWTGFDDPTHAVDMVTVGTALGGAQVGAATAVDVTTGTGFPKPMGAGGYVGMSLSAAQLSARFASAVALNTLTAGSVTVKVFYTVQS